MGLVWQTQPCRRYQRNSTLLQGVAQWSHCRCHWVVGARSILVERIALEKETLSHVNIIQSSHNTSTSFPPGLSVNGRTKDRRILNHQRGGTPKNLSVPNTKHTPKELYLSLEHRQQALTYH